MAEAPPYVEGANERAPNPHDYPPEGSLFAATSDQRTVNNTMRHQYRTLTEGEKRSMEHIKDMGLGLIRAIEAGVPEGREASLARTKVEEAVMWAVKGLTT